MAKPLTQAERTALAIAANDTGGIAGSEWYFGDWLGPLPMCRRLNTLGYLRMPDEPVAKARYRLTPAGRAALDGSTR